MFIQKLRQNALLSQEQLAESSGLSLRTIQRVEAGHRVSYSSLRALAKVFDMDPDKLELELYAMDKTSTEFTEQPLWARLLLNRAFVSSKRSEMMLAEISLALMGAFLGIFYLVRDHSLVDFGPSAEQAFTSMLLLLVSAYLISVFTRLSDKYNAWSSGETEDK